MKLIKPSVEIWQQAPGMSGIYQQIERCARVCYKSEDKIGEGTAEKMVQMLMERGHTAMLEHGTIYLDIPHDCNKLIGDEQRYINNPYSIVNEGEVIYDNVSHEAHYYITTNYRVLYENDWLDDLQYLCEPIEFHEKRVTVHFICDRGISHELVRHRVFSFAQESTRYCNYSKDKFGNELTFIIPCWMSLTMADLKDSDLLTNSESNWVKALQCAEQIYFDLLNGVSSTTIFGGICAGNFEKWTPQQARAVLPNSLKTEVCMTGFMSDWDHFFELRTAQNAHPQMRELAIPLKEMMI